MRRPGGSGISGQTTVAHVVLSLEIGGLERVVVDLVNHATPGLRCEVVCLEGCGALATEVRSGSAAIFELRRRAGFRPALAFRIARLLRSRSVELVHTHNTAAGFYGAVAGRLRGLPVVHTKHGANLGTSGRQGLLNRLAYVLTDHVVAVSQATRDLALREGARPDRLTVVANGIDLERFACGPTERRAARAALGLPDGDFVIGCVARLAPEKNHGLLLDAFSRLPDGERRSRTWLVLVGDGPERAALRARAAAGEHGRRVVFTGPRPDVERVLPAVDVFVLCSDSEGLPVALLEAMASEAVPVVTRVGAMPEVVEDGRAGVVVELGDVEGLTRALAGLRAEGPRRRELASAAQGRVRERYDARRMAREYEKLYSRLLGRDLT